MMVYILGSSIISSSYIVVPKRELVNILNLSFPKFQNNQLHHSKYLSIDIDFNLSRECFLSLSIKSTREISINFSTFLIDYIECI